MDWLEWVIAIVVAVMFGLYLWSSRTLRQVVRKKVQPIVDDLLFDDELEKRTRKPD